MFSYSHSKEHHQGFKQASIGLEGHLPLVSGLNADIIKTPTDIQLGKVSSSAELGHEFRDQWEGVFVLDCHGIEYTIVLNQSEQAILLLDEKHWSCHRRFRGADLSGAQIFL